MMVSGRSTRQRALREQRISGQRRQSSLDLKLGLSVSGMHHDSFDKLPQRACDLLIAADDAAGHGGCEVLGYIEVTFNRLGGRLDA
jgi:hypothetical protein